MAGPFVATGMLVYGLGALVFTIGNAALRQLITPAQMLGKVTASMRLLAWIAQPIAGLLGGWLGSRLSLHGALWVGAAGAATAPIAMLLSQLTRLRGPVATVPSKR